MYANVLYIDRLLYYRRCVFSVLELDEREGKKERKKERKEERKKKRKKEGKKERKKERRKGGKTKTKKKNKIKNLHSIFSTLRRSHGTLRLYFT